MTAAADQREDPAALLRRQPSDVLACEQCQLRRDEQLEHWHPAHSRNMLGGVADRTGEQSSRHRPSVGSVSTWSAQIAAGYSPRVAVKLYWMSISHPSQAARKMLELKGVEYQLVNVLPLGQRVHVRLGGFRGGTVSALKVDGRRIQGTRRIARAVDQLWPAPALFSADPSLRARVEQAERWGELQLQPVPRRLARFGGAHDVAVRRWAAESASFPAPALIARVTRATRSLLRAGA